MAEVVATTTNDGTVVPGVLVQEEDRQQPSDIVDGNDAYSKNNWRSRPVTIEEQVARFEQSLRAVQEFREQQHHNNRQRHRHNDEDKTTAITTPTPKFVDDNNNNDGTHSSSVWDWNYLINASTSPTKSDKEKQQQQRVSGCFFYDESTHPLSIAFYNAINYQYFGRTRRSRSSETAGSTLRNIKEKDQLRCGVFNNSLGFSVFNSTTGTWEGLEIDLVKYLFRICLYLCCFFYSKQYFLNAPKQSFPCNLFLTHKVSGCGCCHSW